jgi:hypothetical protein
MHHNQQKTIPTSPAAIDFPHQYAPDMCQDGHIFQASRFIGKYNSLYKMTLKSTAPAQLCKLALNVLAYVTLLLSPSLLHLDEAA